MDCSLDMDEWPVFPGPDGTETSKEAAVETILQLATRVSQPTHDSRGGRRFGGHSMRTTGAAFLGAQGANPYFIQVLGRWKSGLVARYAGEALSKLAQSHGPMG